MEMIYGLLYLTLKKQLSDIFMAFKEVRGWTFPNEQTSIWMEGVLWV